MNPVLIDFRTHDKPTSQPPVEGLDFDLSGFHDVADYIREALPKRPKPAEEAPDA